jgi:hypothetical protein
MEKMAELPKAFSQNDFRGHFKVLEGVYSLMEITYSIFLGIQNITYSSPDLFQISSFLLP